jgi:hypothetical protein
MTDVMTVGTPDDRLPADWREPTTTTYVLPVTGGPKLDALEERIRDLELVCGAQQKALNLLLLSLPASYSKDLKFKIWPEMEAAEMILDGD